MRTILTLCAVILVAAGIFAWKLMQMPDTFGTFAGAPAVTAADLVERPKEFVGKTVRVEGAVWQQCQTMGCYFLLQTPKGDLRVDLQEIAMNAPMKEGHQVRVEGQMVPYGDGYQLFASAIEFK